VRTETAWQRGAGLPHDLGASDFCGGLGVVEVTVANRYRQGAALRERRLRTFKLTQAQMGSRIAISPELLNPV
jgi:hypothetical protein